MWGKPTSDENANMQTHTQLHGAFLKKYLGENDILWYALAAEQIFEGLDYTTVSFGSAEKVCCSALHFISHSGDRMPSENTIREQGTGSPEFNPHKAMKLTHSPEP